MKPDSLPTEKRIEQYEGKDALLRTWELESKDVQVDNRAYLKGLRERVHAVRNYILHRADPKAVV